MHYNLLDIIVLVDTCVNITH